MLYQLHLPPGPLRTKIAGLYTRLLLANEKKYLRSLVFDLAKGRLGIAAFVAFGHDAANGTYLKSWMDERATRWQEVMCRTYGEPIDYRQEKETSPC